MIYFRPEVIDEFVRHHKLDHQAKQLLEKCLTGPARAVNRGRKHATTTFACVKMGLTLRSESDVELNRYYDHQFNDDVVGYFEQPPTDLYLDYYQASGRHIKTKYQPDVLVMSWLEGLVIEECKPNDVLANCSKDDPVRYCDQGDHYSSEPCEDACLRFGAQFRFVDDRTVPYVRTRNQRLLNDYVFPVAKPSPTVVAKLKRTFSGRDFVLGSELLVEHTRDVLFGAITHGCLFVDIDREPLKRFEHILVYRSRDTRDAWMPLHRSRKRVPFDDDLRQLLPGDRMDLDGRLLKVLLPSDSQITFVDEFGKSLAIDISVLRDQVLAGKATVLDMPSAAPSPTDCASWDLLQKAAARLAVVRKGATEAQQVLAGDVCSRAIGHWRAKVRIAEAAGLDPLDALIDRTSAKGNRTRRLPPETLENVRAHITEVHLQANKMSLRAAFADYDHQVESIPKLRVSRTVYAGEVLRFDSTQVVLAREGQKAAQQIEQFDGFLEESVDRHGQFPLDRVHIDHTVLDIFVLSSNEANEEIRIRPVMTLAVDAFSRAVVGFHVGLRAPSKASVLYCLLDIIRRKHRLPNTIIVDGGSEFYSTDVEKAVALEGAHIRSREGQAPRKGAVVERAFGIQNTVLLHNIYGNTKLSRNVRQLTKKTHDPAGLAHVPFAEMIEAIEEYWFDIHNPSWGKESTMMTPDLKYKAGLQRAGLREHRYLRFDRKLMVKFLPTIGGENSKPVDQQRGFLLGPDYFFNPRFFTDYRPGEYATHIKVNPWDASLAYAWYAGRWVDCSCRIRREQTYDSRYEAWALFEERDVLLGRVYDSQGIAQEQVADLLHGLNSADPAPPLEALTMDDALEELPTNVASEPLMSVPTPAASERVPRKLNSLSSSNWRLQ